MPVQAALSKTFWKDKKVFLTGHTGFKGSWTTLMLSELGAAVHGYALAPHTDPSMFELLKLQDICASHAVDDIRDKDRLAAALHAADPDIVIHMAAQPIVSEGYAKPVETFDINVMGTVHLLEACRTLRKDALVLVVSSDKCYQNPEGSSKLKEHDPLGGEDPYSASKAGTEIVVRAYQESFFNNSDNRTRVVSVRAGNVVGGGDWSLDRLIPDAIRAFTARESFVVFNPDDVRPWQHVIEPVYGYLLLIEKMAERAELAASWNFGPIPSVGASVRDVADFAVRMWGDNAVWDQPKELRTFSETKLLLLDSSAIHRAIGWTPVLNLEETIGWTMSWYKTAVKSGGDAGADIGKLTRQQISDYLQRQSRISS